MLNYTFTKMRLNEKTNKQDKHQKTKKEQVRIRLGRIKSKTCFSMLRVKKIIYISVKKTVFFK